VLRSVDEHRRLRTGIRAQVTERLLTVVRACVRVLGNTAGGGGGGSGGGGDDSDDTGHSGKGGDTAASSGDAARSPTGKDSAGVAAAAEEDEDAWLVDNFVAIVNATRPKRASTSHDDDGDDDGNGGHPEQYFMKYHAKKAAKAKAQAEAAAAAGGSTADATPVDFETDSDDDSDSDLNGGDDRAITETVHVETSEQQEQATLLADVLRRCIHFLSWPRLRIQLVLLETVEVAIRALHAQDTRRSAVSHRVLHECTRWRVCSRQGGCGVSGECDCLDARVLLRVE
jgi:hypothetical protein